MSINFTPLVAKILADRARRVYTWRRDSADIQTAVLRKLLKRAADTEIGRRYAFSDMARSSDPAKLFADRVPLMEYEDIRHGVMRMIAGEKDIFWPGACRNFAQSSGTSGGKSKYIPITPDGLRENHYKGSSDVVAHYLLTHPESRIFSGKGMILGGSFANELDLPDKRVKVGDLSATLIDSINPLAELVRVPSKRIALMTDWERKLPLLASASAKANVTNISGVPSWMLIVLRKVLEISGKGNIADVWPGLEVFFHGGISFAPYREEYRTIMPQNMRYVETYNASEGFFATQNDPFDPAMLLIIDAGVFFEFIPVSGGGNAPVGICGLTEGEVYELVISSVNGLWRYRIGDTVRVDCTAPVKISVAGRTKSFINAFGEELMENNAERAIAVTCEAMGVSIINYTAAPVFAKDGKKGRHEWLIEWDRKPDDQGLFAVLLDENLRRCNSDYDAKRSHDIFLDRPLITEIKRGTFDLWLQSRGNHKLGGQRKVPRLSNDRSLAESILALNK